MCVRVCVVGSYQQKSRLWLQKLIKKTKKSHKTSNWSFVWEVLNLISEPGTKETNVGCDPAEAGGIHGLRRVPHNNNQTLQADTKDTEPKDKNDKYLNRFQRSPSRKQGR